MKNPVGYLCAVMYITVAASILLHYVACVALLALGAYLFVTSMNRHMIDNLKSLKRKNSRLKTLKQLSIFIHTHTKVKQLGQQLIAQ